MIKLNPQPLAKEFFFFLLILIFSSTIFIGTACGLKKNTFQSPPGYDFSQPFLYKLPAELNEISGLYFYKKDSGIFAINDEKGFLYKIHLTFPLQIQKWKFSKSGDYEDVTFADSSIYVLQSKGILERLKFIGPDSIFLESFKIPADGKNEFETAYYDEAARQVIVICKSCEQDDKKHISSWAFNPSDNSFTESFTIQSENAKDEINSEKKIKPSAAAIHPLTKELYILASVNKILLVLKPDHSIARIYKLDPVLFKQPEGMTFTPKGDLIISNESAEKGPATILFFRYTKPIKE